MDLKIRYALWTRCGILILDDMDFGLDLDMESDQLEPSAS